MSHWNRPLRSRLWKPRALASHGWYDCASSMAQECLCTCLKSCLVWVGKTSPG